MKHMSVSDSDRTAVTMIVLDSIRTDGGTQPRLALDPKVIGDYQDLYEDGVQLPPITVYYDGSDYWLADGFHRLNAARAAGGGNILADIRPGTLADALWYSFGANKAHGLRRSHEDKQRAVMAALRHPACAGLSNREIGRHVGVDHKTVAVWREKLSGEIPQSKGRTGKDGGAMESPSEPPSSSTSAEFRTMADCESAIKTEIRKLQAVRDDTAWVIKELLSQLPTIIQSGNQVVIVRICSMIADCTTLIEQIEANLPPPEVLDRIAGEGGGE
jgi:transposase-like protein